MRNPEKRFEQILSRLKAKKHKLTPQLIAIAKILAESDDHPDIETIYNRVRTDFPRMSLATVYRNVMVMKSMGDVLEIGFPGGGNRYEGNRVDPHPHAVCERCRKIIDLETGGMAEFVKSIERDTGFAITKHRLDFFGLCPDCRNRQ